MTISRTQREHAQEEAWQKEQRRRWWAEEQGHVPATVCDVSHTDRACSLARTTRGLLHDTRHLLDAGDVPAAVDAALLADEGATRARTHARLAGTNDARDAYEDARTWAAEAMGLVEEYL